MCDHSGVFVRSTPANYLTMSMDDQVWTLWTHVQKQF